MALALFALLLIINFAISWHNAVTVGRMWSESKAIGGQIRLLAVAGYIMAIIGFTMVYSILLLMVAPYIISLFPDLQSISIPDVVSLSSDLTYVLVATSIIPTGLIIWYNSAVRFWNRRTFGSGMTAAYNTYAQIRNTVNAARNLPSAFSRITGALFGGKGKKKADGAVILLAILILVFAVCAGWFTASALLKRADREYDGMPAPPRENNFGTPPFGAEQNGPVQSHAERAQTSDNPFGTH